MIVNNLQKEEEIISKWEIIQNKPIISILCVTYNQENYIEDAIFGFLKQEISFPFEIIIHDDASTDKTAKIIKSYEKCYPKIITGIYQSENQYSKGNSILKIVLPYLSGEYVALCDGDDYWIDPYKLLKQVDFLRNNPKFSICYHNTKWITRDQSKTDIMIKKNIKTFSIKDIIFGEGGHTSSFLFRRKYLNTLPQFVFSSSIGDYPLRLYFATVGQSGYINNVMSIYRKNISNSWSELQTNLEQRIMTRKNILEMLDDFDNYTNHKYHQIIYDRKIQIVKTEVFRLWKRHLGTPRILFEHITIIDRYLIFVSLKKKLIIRYVKEMLKKILL